METPERIEQIDKNIVTIKEILENLELLKSEVKTLKAERFKYERLYEEVSRQLYNLRNDLDERGIEYSSPDHRSFT